MGKSNNRRDSTKFDDYADEYEDYGSYRDMDSDVSSDPAQASTATKAKMSSPQAKQNAKRGNQTDR
jgi:hypothetical protein